MSLSHWVLWAVQAYAWVGLVLGVAFVLFGKARVDAAAAGLKPLFSIVILPGCVLLWPWVLSRWARVGLRSRGSI